MLRSEIDFYASGAISESKETIEERIAELSPKLGFSIDSLAILTTRKQNLGYTKLLKDTLVGSLSPADFNKRGLHIQSWESVIGVPGETEGFFGAANQLFNDVGRLKMQFSNQGKVIRVESHHEHPNPTFLSGDSLLSIAGNLLFDVFGYDTSNYTLNEGDFTDTTLHQFERDRPVQSFENVGENQPLAITWIRNQNSSGLPEKLTLNLQPVVKEFDNEGGFRTEFGFSIQSFSATNNYEPLDLTTSSKEAQADGMLFTYLLFISLFVLVVFVFSVGLRSIFKGKVEWRRALIMFLAISLGTYGWRAIYFMHSYNPFLSNAGMFGANVNNLIFALLVGLYASMAYISWEALARSQKQKQVDIIDALWQRKFFVSETGAGLVHGFALGGIVIGVISSILFLMGEFLIQADSQFGFSEASITPKLLTINMSAWATTWLVAIGQIGFVYAILNQWINKKWLAGILAILLSGIFITVLGRLAGTSGTVFQDLVIFMAVAIVFIYSMMEFGLLTVCTGWWFFTVFFMISPYLGSPAYDVAYVSWVQAFIMAGPLIYGFLSYRYGISVSEVGDYIPEYEERISQHLRVEKEIEIARESQYKLMPLLPPKAEGIDVYGFFLPSFEVGGDYFDYILSYNGEGNAAALIMAVVDVSGKAMRAAMPAVFTSGLLLSRMKDDMPDEVLSRITEPIFTRTDKRTFITCALARYDFKTMKMSIANAGHCRPVLKRNGLAEYIYTPEPAYPLGIKEEVTYKSETISMKKGDFFLMYSDGLPEAVNEKGDRFGFEEVPRLIESIDTENLSAHEIAQEIKRTVQKFSNYQLADDTTIICLKI